MGVCRARADFCRCVDEPLYFLYLETFKATDPLDELCLDGRILFKWIVPNESVLLCSGPV
jgi:hypothetical protein